MGDLSGRTEEGGKDGTIFMTGDCGVGSCWWKQMISLVVAINLPMCLCKPRILVMILWHFLII